jgi:phospholipid-binding lipoprotein MlaA
MRRTVARTAWRLAVARTAWCLAATCVLAASGAGLASETTGAEEPGPAGGAEVDPPPSQDFDPLFDEDEPEPEVWDPLESSNRAVLGFNDGVDRVLWKPLGKAFRFVLPDPVETSLANAFWNLDTPAIFVNDLLQGRPVDAGRTLGRFFVNTTVGLGGLLDPAAAIGLPRQPADFGQTLGRWGAGPGPFLVVPFVGPASLREGFGGVFDALLNPLTYVIGPGGDLVLGVVFLNFGKGIAVQEGYRAQLEALEEGSVDYYATLRSAYVQSRDAAIREAVEASNATGKLLGVGP